MKYKRHILGIAGALLCASANPIFAQPAPADHEGPDRILKMLDEKERRHIEGKADASNLSPEEIEHVQRVQRLHHLETAGEVEKEPAGADIVFPQQEPLLEELELQQEESKRYLMRDIARLRAEISRLDARVRELEMNSRNTENSVDEAEPDFYVPAR